MADDLNKYAEAYQGSIYDFDNEIMMNWYSDQIIKESRCEEKVLELGIGHGFTTKKFVNHFSNYNVIEGSQEVIDNFQLTHTDVKINFHLSYFEEYSTNERYDIIIMGFVLEHVDNPVLLLNKFKRFLNETGRIYIAVPNAESMNRRLGVYAKDLDKLTTLSENDFLLGHLRYYSVESLKKDLIEAGLNIKYIEGLYLKPFTTKQIVSLELTGKYIDALCELGRLYPELSSSILARVSL